MLSTLTFLNVLALAGAAYFQHVLNYNPCSWCILIRVILAALITVSALALFKKRTLLRVAQGLSAGLGLAGVATASYLNVVASHSDSCFKTFADKVVGFLHLDTLAPWYFDPRGLCSDASVKIAGIPMEAYALILFMGYAIYGVVELSDAWANRSKPGTDL